MTGDARLPGDSPQVVRLHALVDELVKLLAAAGAIPERPATDPLRAIHARAMILNRMATVVGEIGALAGEVDADELADGLIDDLDQLRRSLGDGRPLL